MRLDRPIQATVNVQFIGESPGAKQGGVVQQVTRELRVEALPTAVPEHIDADISGLEIGDTVRVADLDAIEGVSFLDDPETVLANCSVPRGITELEEAEAAEGEEAEGCRGRGRRAVGRGRDRGLRVRLGVTRAPLPEGRGRDIGGPSRRGARQPRA